MYFDAGAKYLVMEYLEMGSLSSLLPINESSLVTTDLVAM